MTDDLDPMEFPLPPGTHVYRREVGTQLEDSLHAIVQGIVAGSEVLDVGTGSGALGRYLGRTQCLVDGVTYNPQEAQQAAPHYRRVHVLDLENSSVAEALGAARYDVVVCADVLEHLRNARQVLRELGDVLKPDGKLVLSVPNVTHLGVILGLMAGRFVRTHEGLLDATHVHFMDRVALQTLVHSAGFEVVHEDFVPRNLAQTEFASLDWLVLPAAVRTYVAALPDAQIYQFVWTLKRTSDAASGPELVAPSVPHIAQTPRFQAQLHFDRGDGRFSAADCADAYGEQSGQMQTLRFAVPDGASVHAVRLDLADRPGQLEFTHVRALDAQGQEQWRWEGDWSPFLRYHQCQWTGLAGWNGGRVVRCTGPDPWVALPLGEGAWRQVCNVELRMTSPEPTGSTDWPGLNMRQLQDMLRRLSEQSEGRMATLEANLNSARTLADFRQTDIDALRLERDTLRRLAEADKESLRQEMDSLRQIAKADKDKLSFALQQKTTELQRILATRSWRWTRPWRAIARWLGIG